jgi:hypothetical protein
MFVTPELFQKIIAKKKENVDRIFVDRTTLKAEFLM